MTDNSVLSSYYIVLIKLNMRRLDKMISVIPWNNIIDGPRGFEELARDYVRDIYKYPDSSWNETPATHDGNKDGYLIIVGYHSPNIMDDKVWWMEAKYINETEKDENENNTAKNQSNKYLHRFKLDATIVSSIFNKKVTRIVFVTNVEVKAKVISDVRTALAIATNCKETFFCTKHLLEYWLCTHEKIYRKHFGTIPLPNLSKDSIFVSDDIEIYGNVSNMKLAQPLQNLTTNRIYHAYCKVISGQNQKVSIRSAQKGFHIKNYNLKQLHTGENLLHIGFTVTDKYFEGKSVSIENGDGYRNLCLFKLNRTVNLTSKTVFSITENLETHLNIQAQQIFKDNYEKILPSRNFYGLIEGESGTGKTTIIEECIELKKSKNYNTYYVELQDEKSINLSRLMEALFFVLFPFIYIDDLTQDTIKSRKLDSGLTKSLLRLLQSRNYADSEKAVMEFAEKKYVINDCDEYNNGCALFVDNVHKLDPIGAQFLSCILNLFKKFKLHIILATQPSFTQGKLFEEYFNCITLQKFSFQLIRADVENNLKNIFGLSEPINTELLDAFFPNLIVFNLFVQYTKSLDEKICTLPDLVYIYISFRKNVSENSYILEQFENIRINHPDAWNVCAQIYKKPLGISCELNPNTELLIAKRLIKQNDYGNLVPIHDIYTQCFQNHFHVSGNSDNELDALDRQINSYQVTGIAEETYEKIFHLRQTEQFYSVEYILSPIFSTDQQEKYRKLWGDEMFYLLYFEYSYAAVQNSRTTIGYDGFEIILKGINGTSSKRLNILQLEVIFELINSHFNVGEYSECEILFKQFNETYDRLVNIYGINPDKNSCLFYVLSNNYMLYIASEKNISESYTAADAQKNLLKEKYPYHYVDFLFRYGRTLFVRDWNTACIWIEDAMKEVQNFSNKQGLLVTFYAKFIDYINQKEGAYIGSMEQVIRECSKSFYSSSRHLNLLYCGLLYVKGYTSQADTLLLKDIAEARKIRTKMDAAYKQILAIYYLRHNDIDNAQEALRQSVSLFSFNSSYRRISQHNLEVLKNIDLNNMRYEVCTSPCLDPDTIYLDPRVY